MSNKRRTQLGRLKEHVELELVLRGPRWRLGARGRLRHLVSAHRPPLKLKWDHTIGASQSVEADRLLLDSHQSLEAPIATQSFQSHFWRKVFLHHLECAFQPPGVSKVDCRYPGRLN